MVESQFLLHPRAGPALEAGVIFFVLRHLRALRLPLMPYGIIFSMLVQWGYATMIFCRGGYSA